MRAQGWLEPNIFDPLHLNIADAFARTSQMQWTETVPDLSYAKILWVGSSPLVGAAMVRWMRRYAGPLHKHLVAAPTFIVSCQLRVDAQVYAAGDYVYEPSGIIHHRAEALEDTDFLFISNGPIMFLVDQQLSH